MKTIYKYPLQNFSLNGEGVLALPRGAKIISAGRQGSIQCIWALVDTELPLEPRQLCVICTGQNIPNNLAHIASWQDPPFVWHLFERKD